VSVRVAGLVAATLVAAACSSSTGPSGATSHPGINLIAGNQQTDTVQTVLNQALVVQINQSNGAPAANQIVQFQAISADTTPFPNAGDWCDPVPLLSNQPVSFVADSTDAQGQASVGIALGTRAGKARLLVRVPALGYVDTATFTVTAGAAASLVTGPDTSVYVNGTVNLHSAVLDRFGNPRTDAVTYSVLSGPAKLSGSTVTITGFGQALIAGMADSKKDTTIITGLPSGSIAASLDAGGIVTFNLDGSGYKTITSTAAGTVVWAPNGASVAFDQTQGGGTEGGSATLLSATVPAGSVSTLDNSGGSIDAWPAYSRDGSWIYYVKITNSADIWRVHPDGSGDAMVTMQATNPAQFPSPSPDGTQLAYVVPGAANVEILTLATGAQTQLGSVAAISVAWSPSSNQIAFTGAGSVIGVVNSDGTGQSFLTTAPYYPQLGWSPDGKWIIARNQSTNKIDLISVTTPNLVLPVGFTGSVGSPSWH
jgi:WD40-like Beta Propeller Repeat